MNRRFSSNVLFRLLTVLSLAGSISLASAPALAEPGNGADLAINLTDREHFGGPYFSPGCGTSECPGPAWYYNFLLTVTNAGPQGAKNGVATVDLPPNTHIPCCLFDNPEGLNCFAMPVEGDPINDRQLYCVFTDLERNGSLSTNIEVKILAPGSYTFSGSVSSETIDRKPLNNKDSLTTTVELPPSMCC